MLNVSREVFKDLYDKVKIEYKSQVKIVDPTSLIVHMRDKMNLKDNIHFLYLDMLRIFLIALSIQLSII